MNEELDREAEEILAVITALDPLIKSYKRGDLSDEEMVFLRNVAQSLWPTLQSVIVNIRTELEPIMKRLGLWPPEEE